MRRASFASLALVGLLLTGACGSSNDVLGSLGGILGSPSQDQPSDVRGTVNAVDARSMRIDLDASYINNLRDTSTQITSVYYDNKTTVQFNNSTYNVADLERGDEVTIRGYNDNGRYYAQTITVTRDVSR